MDGDQNTCRRPRISFRKMRLVRALAEEMGGLPEIIRFIDELANRMAVLLGHLRDRVDAKLQELTKAIRPSGLELEKLKGYSSWRPYPAA